MINDPPLVEDVPPRSWEIPIARPRCCATSIGSPLRYGEALQGVRVRNVDTLVPNFHCARFPQPPQGPGDRLPVGPDHARELIVGVAGTGAEHDKCQARKEKAPALKRPEALC